MSTSMRPSTPKAGHVPLVEIVITEQLDTMSVPALEERLQEAFALEPEQLVLNLAACPFIDAAAMEVLLNMHRHALRVGSSLVLRSPSPRLRRSLQLTHLDKVFSVAA